MNATYTVWPDYGPPYQMPATRVLRWQAPIVRCVMNTAGIYHALLGPELDRDGQTRYRLSVEFYRTEHDLQVAFNAGALTWRPINAEVARITE